jgi:hypothetical protein
LKHLQGSLKDVALKRLQGSLNQAVIAQEGVEGYFVVQFHFISFLQWPRRCPRISLATHYLESSLSVTTDYGIADLVMAQSGSIPYIYAEQFR